MNATSLINRNIKSPLGRTSMKLEPELWDALDEICAAEKTNRHAAVNAVWASVTDANADGSRTSAVRVFIVNYFRNPARRAVA